MQYEEVLSNIWDTVIVGGGPGGMGAALYAARADLSTLVVEKSFIGGLIALTTDVENYPAIDFANGMELAQRMEAQVKKFGTEILYKEVVRIDVSAAVPGREAEDGAHGGAPSLSPFAVNFADGKALTARTVIVACGSAPRRIPAKGEEEYYGKGVSYCATCDGAFFRNKDIVVVGGGESAFQEGHFLTQFGKKVTLVHRRDAFRATPLAIRRARASEKWSEKLGYVVDEIYGEGVVTGVKLRNVASDAVEDMPIDGVFGFIGYDPASHFAGHLIERDADGYIVVDAKMRTTRPGIWACGDIVKGSLKQMVISAGNGATAAIDIREWLAEHKQ
ncbi:MAG: FAD-dependent oxidoreductase [bacterium]|nr:FAD-dependent oxidoreductase [bacterium]